MAMIAKTSQTFVSNSRSRLETADRREVGIRFLLYLPRPAVGPGLATAGCGNTAADSARTKTFCRTTVRDHRYPDVDNMHKK